MPQRVARVGERGREREREGRTLCRLLHFGNICISAEEFELLSSSTLANVAPAWPQFMHCLHRENCFGHFTTTTTRTTTTRQLGLPSNRDDHKEAKPSSKSQTHFPRSQREEAFTNRKQTTRKQLKVASSLWHATDSRGTGRRRGRGRGL